MLQKWTDTIAPKTKPYRQYLLKIQFLSGILEQGLEPVHIGIHARIFVKFCQ
jgi:hypothetical protein